MANTFLRKLLDETISWGQDLPRISALKRWSEYPALLEALDTLQVDVLYKSPIHGQDHVERTLLMAALVAQGEISDPLMVRQLFACACYHDIGRVCDYYETGHGSRSAVRLEELTGFSGEPLREMQGAVAAHSWPDRDMERVVAEYGPADFSRALELAKLLKDADGLDRVRIDDLSAEFMRHETAKQLALDGLPYRVYSTYRAALDLPFFSIREWRRTHPIKP